MHIRNQYLKVKKVKIAIFGLFVAALSEAYTKVKRRANIELAKADLLEPRLLAQM